MYFFYNWPIFPGATPRLVYSYKTKDIYIPYSPYGISSYMEDILHRATDKSLARPWRKQANVSVRMAWISFGALTCRKKKTWWQLASRCCWNCARLWHDSDLPGRAKDLSAPGTITFAFKENRETGAQYKVSPRSSVRRECCHQTIKKKKNLVYEKRNQKFLWHVSCRTKNDNPLK